MSYSNNFSSDHHPSLLGSDVSIRSQGYNGEPTDPNAVPVNPSVHSSNGWTDSGVATSSHVLQPHPPELYRYPTTHGYHLQPNINQNGAPSGMQPIPPFQPLHHTEHYYDPSPPYVPATANYGQLSPPPTVFSSTPRIYSESIPHTTPPLSEHQTNFYPGSENGQQPYSPLNYPPNFSANLGGTSDQYPNIAHTGHELTTVTTPVPPHLRKFGREFPQNWQSSFHPYPPSAYQPRTFSDDSNPTSTPSSLPRSQADVARQAQQVHIPREGTQVPRSEPPTRQSPESSFEHPDSIPEEVGRKKRVSKASPSVRGSDDNSMGAPGPQEFSNPSKRVRPMLRGEKVPGSKQTRGDKTSLRKKTVNNTTVAPSTPGSHSIPQASVTSSNSVHSGQTGSQSILTVFSSETQGGETELHGSGLLPEEKRTSEFILNGKTWGIRIDLSEGQPSQRTFNNKVEIPINLVIVVLEPPHQPEEEHSHHGNAKPLQFGYQVPKNACVVQKGKNKVNNDGINNSFSPGLFDGNLRNHLVNKGYKAEAEAVTEAVMKELLCQWPDSLTQEIRAREAEQRR
ncbi:hypothetical protein QFC19_001473 [Naganishia cerealis]|uniref:Uncharacterized protein n=1 Tax=Naganishia cerealis TaxID=610337 RepID=A0ACC2WHG4_9TREE|nr:hypothetical protein QFC19_001473 [Naganishia cerealis]